ncbi:MAG: NADH-quinone oxidoreductase subunit H [Verrucomicrobia bacterium]|nr:NADH-quinone oxidoreductase subunit H [Verrucomicrobiota bacterium]
MDPILIHLIKIVGVVGVLLFICAYIVLAERRICAFIQDRLGPNRVGIPIWIRKDGRAIQIGACWALGQPIIDALKAILKEDFVPGHVNKFYFWLGPMLVMAPALMVWAAIPFGSTLCGVPMIVADINVGILFVFAIASLGVYGIVLGGWASNSKYPFLGGVRSSAQLISYELCLGLSVIPLFMQVGSLRLTEVVRWQTEHLWLICYPWNWLPAIIYVASSFAETNRAPFDLPEAEQELAGGYNTEYSSMKFAMFFLAEYANMITASALLAVLFLGGWHLPFVPVSGGIAVGIAHICIFLAKVCALALVFIWVRWTVPRVRYDQLMGLGWKVFLPLALVSILIAGLAIVAGWSPS